MFTLLEKKFLRETFKTLFNVLQKMSCRKSLRRYKVILGDIMLLYAFKFNLDVTDLLVLRGKHPFTFALKTHIF